MSQDTFLYVEKITSDNGNITTNGAGLLTTAKATVTAALLASDGKLGKTAAGDILDGSGATALIKGGPSATAIQFSTVAGDTSGIIDKNSNKFIAVGTSSYSALSATNHNHGTSTPTLMLSTMNNGASAAQTATVGSIGTITATQYTPAGTTNLTNVIAGVA